MTIVKMPASLRPLFRRIGRLAHAQGLRAYAVGGCVRDWRLGRAGGDVDVTVEGDGIALARAVASALGGHVVAHPAFGTATVRLPGRAGLRVDVATCRKETYARPGAYPRVARGTLREDLRRRDFTINAMAVSLAPGRFGVLRDPFRGAADLRRRILRILHPRSFLDDPSRILRGVRFAQRFGLRWEPRTARALRAAVAAGALEWLNAGRLRKELDLLLREPNPRACLQQLGAVLEP
jgi:tRNA nucleotidyltransferase (CCA-adding enzyme)